MASYIPNVLAHVYIHVVIAMLGKRLTLRQRVIATATVFFRRFYVKNLYCETDPFIVIAACCYVAAKAEESPVHIKNVVSESRLMFSRTCELVSICHSL
jgi:cyclin C